MWIYMYLGDTKEITIKLFFGNHLVFTIFYKSIVIYHTFIHTKEFTASWAFLVKWPGFLSMFTFYMCAASIFGLPRYGKQKQY